MRRKDKVSDLKDRGDRSDQMRRQSFTCIGSDKNAHWVEFHPSAYLCLPLQQVTCKSEDDVGVNEDCPQVNDAGVGFPSSRRPR